MSTASLLGPMLLAVICGCAGEEPKLLASSKPREAPEAPFSPFPPQEWVKRQERRPSYDLYAKNDEDFELARASLDYAREQFTKAFGRPPPRIAVIVFPSRKEFDDSNIGVMMDKGQPFLPWFTSSYFGTQVDGDEWKLLAHEAAHLFFDFHVDRHSKEFQDVSHIEPDHYGHNLMPDWLDEAASTYAEPEEMKEWRRAYLRQHLAKAWPIERLLTMHHAAVPAVHKEMEKMGEGAIPPTVMKVPTKELDDWANMFYAQTLTLAEFLVERSPGVLEKFVRARLSGKSFESVLRSDDALPDSIAELEREWKASVIASGD